MSCEFNVNSMAQLTQYSINSFSWAKNSVAASALEVPDDGLILAGDDPPRFQSWYMISPPVVAGGGGSPLLSSSGLE